MLDVINSKQDLDYIIVDTPGQMEAFSWSASGMIIADALASEYPTSLLYIIDTQRCVNPNTFMSNMLYATSVYYKLKLPLVIVYSKTDLQNADFALN